MPNASHLLWISTIPAWTVVTWIDSEPYTPGPRRTGHIALATAALFALFTGALIRLLVERVQRRTALLQEANDQLEAQNRQVQKANARIAQATENKSQFLRRMAHGNLENIESSSNILLSLINEILDLSRIEAGRVEVNVQSVDVRQLANESADALESIVARRRAAP